MGWSDQYALCARWEGIGFTRRQDLVRFQDGVPLRVRLKARRWALDPKIKVRILGPERNPPSRSSPNGRRRLIQDQNSVGSNPTFGTCLLVRQPR